MKYLLCFLFPVVIFATEKVPVQNITNVTNVTQSALSYAIGQTNMDWSTDKTQVSMGFGFAGDKQAAALSFGKKPCQDCALITGTLGTEDGKNGFGVGFTARF